MTDKREMEKELFELLSVAANKLLDTHAAKLLSDSERMQEVLGVDATQMKHMLFLIVHELPNSLLVEENAAVKNYMLLYITQELIFFLAQENFGSEEFLDYFENFKDGIKNHLQNEVFVKKEGA